MHMRIFLSYSSSFVALLTTMMFAAGFIVLSGLAPLGGCCCCFLRVASVFRLRPFVHAFVVSSKTTLAAEKHGVATPWLPDID